MPTKRLRSKPPPISPLESHLGYWLRYVSNHVSHSFQRKVAATGVTVAEWVLLREMYECEAVSPTDLVEATGLTKGTISKLLARLERKRLAHRESVPQDRRGQIVTLTPTGRALVPELARLADFNDAEFFGHLSHRQRRQLEHTLRQLVSHHQLRAIPGE